MIRRTIRLVWTGAVLAFLAYLLFFVRLGERTPFQHLMRVAGTDEAQELGREVGAATERITKKIGDQVHEATKPPEQDAGAGHVPEKISDKLEGILGDAQERAERLEASSARDLE
ncbi:MAG: hypothetical protein KJO40_16415 [Deltaproteobacteria bacterium]|nr:hypothetical protein [Deltaproteobacteria bacterium]NND29527.1 hypothetical protein [Myxococcales bacterium]MBT8464362.1 hypothetical protein [Deltaproteobacteria bacterium]MBT8480506.1 hypothetical protein [Deltaproteobacteria bacterium]NNK09388.1 hypothetical protein [Myxococcales bacterium]